MDRHTARLKEMAIAARDMVADRGLDWLRAEVILIFDVSASMRPMYQARLVQELANQLLALGISFDDDGMIPAYAFGSRCRHLRDLTVRDFHGYVDREVIRSEGDYQGECRFGTAINDVCAYYFPEDWRPVEIKEVRDRTLTKRVKSYAELSAPRAIPVFAIVVTGGDFQDQEATADLIRQSSRFPIFFHFVGLSPPGSKASFSFLEQLNSLDDTYVDNCGFFEPRDVTDPRALVAGLLNELPDYLHSPMIQLMVKSAHRGGLTTRGKRRAPEPPPPAPASEHTAKPSQPTPEAARTAESLIELRAKLADVEWARTSLHGSPAKPPPKLPPISTKAATQTPAPSATKPEAVPAPAPAPKTLARPRSQRPRRAFRTDAPMATEETGVQQRIALLRAELAALEAHTAPKPAPVAVEHDPEDDEATQPGAGKSSVEMRKLRARLAAQDDDVTGII